ncbi:MAG TPA: SRPBCC domain-containing protein [Streptosporangiaceae bacterium]|nr:SRPBCC domain-containing protein [Streptosporangiaceae bacterium]
MTKTGTHEITISRVFDAPPELVYRMFVDPDQLCQWFGPVGFSVPCETVQIDARPGGFQRFVMISDDDPAFRSPVDATFSEVIENELLAGHQDVEGIPGTTGTIRFHLRLEFLAEPGGKTRLVLHQGPFTEEMGDQTAAGWESSFTKLDSLLRRSL